MWEVIANILRKNWHHVIDSALISVVRVRDSMMIEKGGRRGPEDWHLLTGVLLNIYYAEKNALLRGSERDSIIYAKLMAEVKLLGATELSRLKVSKKERAAPVKNFGAKFR